MFHQSRGLSKNTIESHDLRLHADHVDDEIGMGASTIERRWEVDGI